MNKASFIVFFSFALIIYLGIHYYVYIRIAKGLGLSRNLEIILLLLFIMGAFSFIAGEAIRPMSHIYWIVFIGGVWLGVLVISLSVFLVKDLVYLVLNNYQHTLTLISLGVIFFCSLYALYNAGRPPVVKEIKLKTQKIQSQLKGLSIIQISDIHLGTVNGHEKMGSIVKKVNSLNPDIIFITGDLIDRDICDSEQFCKVLTGFRAKHGIYAVTGNHEFYAGVDKFDKLMKRAGIISLRNKKVTLFNSIELIGVDDKTARRFGLKISDPARFIRKSDKKKYIILLKHTPDDFKSVSQAGVDLQISGHTHVGQLPPLYPLVFLAFKYAYGLHTIGSSSIYTTSGTAFWGPPMRLFSRSEIVKFIIN